MGPLLFTRRARILAAASVALLVAGVLAPSAGLAVPIDLGQVEVTSDGRLLIGVDAYGERTVLGSIDGPYAGVEIASGATSRGKLALTSGARLSATALVVGGPGEHASSVPRPTALVRVEGGSSVFTSSASVGAGALSGEFGVEVSGPGSSWINSGQIDMSPALDPRGWTSFVEITEGGYVSTGGISSSSGSSGSSSRLRVDGDGSRLISFGGLRLGSSRGSGQVELTVSNSGSVSAAQTTFGAYSPGGAVATITGAGSTWVTGDLALGAATIRVSDGARIHSSHVANGGTEVGAYVSISGAGSRWDVDGSIEAGFDPILIGISDRGTLTSNGASFPNFGGVSVSGSGSAWIDRGAVSLWRNAGLSIKEGGRVETLDTRLRAGAIPEFVRGARATVSGAGSAWVSRGELLVGGTESFVPKDAASIQIFDGGSLWAESLAIQEYGVVELSNGSVDGGTVLISGGTLRGSGSVTAPVRNEGVIEPEGTLSIRGPLEQTETGSLGVQFRSLLDFDLLDVGSTATLGGLLSIEWLAGVLPDFGDRFEVMRWDERIGRFSEISGLQLDPTHFLEPVYEAEGLVLQAELDSDQDGLRDHEETLIHSTDPLRADTDGDGLLDGPEVVTYATDPTRRDTDGGGRADGPEVQLDATDPLSAADDVLDILVLDEPCAGNPAHLPGVMQALGAAFVRSADPAAFDASLADGTSWDVILVGLSTGPLSTDAVSRLRAHVSSGGRLLVSAPDPDPALVQDLDAAVASSVDAPRSVKRWSGACCGPRHPLYDDPRLSRALVPERQGCGVRGAAFDPTAAGIPLAGYSGDPGGGEAAIVVGNQGRSILLGFDPGLYAAAEARALLESAVKFLLDGYPVYTLSGTYRVLLRIDRDSSGDPLSSVDVSVPGETITGARALARDPASGELWALLDLSGRAGAELVRLDPRTGIATRVGDAGPGLSGLAVDCRGRLHAVSGDSASPPETLYMLDPQSGAPTPVASLRDEGPGEKLAFQPADGRLYHLSGDVLAAIDPETGAATQVPLSGDPFRLPVTALSPSAETSASLLLGDPRGDLFLVDASGSVSRQGSIGNASDGLADFSVHCCGDPEDVDCDGIPNAADLCPAHPGANPQRDVDRNGIGDECECGDQTGDGIVDVRDIVGINLEIYGQVLASLLCDTNEDGNCDVSDIIGVNQKAYGGVAHCSRYPRPAP